MDDIWDAVNDYGDRMDIGPIGLYHQEITNATKRNAGLMDFLRISSLGIPKSIGKSSVSRSNGHFRSFLCV